MWKNEFLLKILMNIKKLENIQPFITIPVVYLDFILNMSSKI
jgi:hypothetical protein